MDHSRSVFRGVYGLLILRQAQPLRGPGRQVKPVTPGPRTAGLSGREHRQDDPPATTATLPSWRARAVSPWGPQPPYPLRSGAWQERADRQRSRRTTPSATSSRLRTYRGESAHDLRRSHTPGAGPMRERASPETPCRFELKHQAGTRVAEGNARVDITPEQLLQVGRIREHVRDSLEPLQVLCRERRGAAFLRDRLTHHASPVDSNTNTPRRPQATPGRTRSPLKALCRASPRGHAPHPSC